MHQTHAERQLGCSVQSGQQQHDTSTALLTSDWYGQIDTSTLLVCGRSEARRDWNVLGHGVESRSGCSTYLNRRSVNPARVSCLLKVGHACVSSAPGSRVAPTPWVAHTVLAAAFFRGIIRDRHLASGDVLTGEDFARKGEPWVPRRDIAFSPANGGFERRRSS